MTYVYNAIGIVGVVAFFFIIVIIDSYFTNKHTKALENLESEMNEPSPGMMGLSKQIEEDMYAPQTLKGPDSGKKAPVFYYADDDFDSLVKDSEKSKKKSKKSKKKGKNKRKSKKK